MAQIETWFEQDLKKPVKVTFLDGNVFSADNNGNKVGVKVYSDGEPVTLTGTISGNVIRPDGTTVAVTGASSGNSAWIVLPQAAYTSPGVVSIIIKNTVDSAIATICAVVATVYESTTSVVVDPGTIIPSIETLITSIQNAVASIPADYSALWTSLAPAFSTTASYVPGQYVTYNGGVYRFITTHTGSWVAADAVSVNIGGELYDVKSAIDNMTNVSNITLTSGNVNGNVGETVTINTSSANYKYTEIYVTPGWGYLTTYLCRSSKSKYVFFVDKDEKILSIGKIVSVSDGTENTEYNVAPTNAVKMYVVSYIHNSQAKISIKASYNLIDENTKLNEIAKYSTEKTDNIFYYTHPNNIGTSVVFEKDGTITINGTLTSNILLPIMGAEIGGNNVEENEIISSNRFTKGTVSGGSVTLRIYSSDTGISTSQNVEFASDDCIYVRVLAGTYSNYNVGFVIVHGTTRASEYYPCMTGFDYKAREKANKNKDDIDGLVREQVTSAFNTSLKSKNRMLFSAHRGAEGQAPYGSFPAYELACQQGWDMITIAQARQSADGTWYCLHDASVDAQTNGTGNIAELTDEYIATIYQDVGENIESYTAEQMKLPTLKSVLQLAYKYGVKVCVRMGSLPENVDTETNRAAWDSFISLVSNFSPEYMIFSGNSNQVLMLKQLTNNLHGNVYLTSYLTQTVDYFASLGTTNLSFLAGKSLVSESTIQYIHSKGYKYMCSQINTPTLSDFEELSNWGCDIAQTGISSIHSLIS